MTVTCGFPKFVFCKIVGPFNKKNRRKSELKFVFRNNLSRRQYCEVLRLTKTQFMLSIKPKSMKKVKTIKMISKQADFKANFSKLTKTVEKCE